MTWEKLAEPFTAADVKERQGPKRHDGQCQKQYGQCQLPHKMLSYVNARAVMQRLDDVVRPEGWEFTSTVIPGTDVVHGRLTIAGVVREDYGYPNSDQDEEPIKAASSDALKRCAVMFGIGRHLYDDNSSASAGRVASSARPAARPTVVREEPEEPEMGFAPIGGKSAPAEIPTDNCPIHDVPWNGEPGDLWHKGPEGYCRHPENVRKARRA